MTIKFEASKENLLYSLSLLQNIAGKKGTLAILSNILIKSQGNNVELIATDLEIGIKNELDANIISQGSITLPAKILYELVKESCSDFISIEEQDNYWVKIVSGTSVYNLAGISSEEYPDFPEYNEDMLVDVKANLFKELIDKTLFSIAHDRENNFTLTGALLEKEQIDNNNYIRMVSSDGHRLSIKQTMIEDDLSTLNIDKNTIIPRKGILEIRKLCETSENDNIKIGFDNKQLVVKSNNSLMIIRLMNGDFPDYKNLLKIINRKNSIEVERKTFLESLRRTNLFTESIFNAVHLNIQKNIMILSSQNTDYGSATDKITIEYEGETLALGFNCKYFIEAIQVMSSEFINIYINSEQSPCLIEGKDDIGFVNIIMPMKI
ncbi:MAG: DNA polymerase III subunit beta [Deltaproteobacteria bacterium RIFOXYD12_FULL_57_12]|nr:MAG: DNA polymerase III subunit beta [Deltaproteobacteria bacterium RIFOXYD12_FULL_57_12]